MNKICKDCRKPFNQFTTTQNRCGDCAYKYNMKLAYESTKKARRRQGSGYKWSHAKRQWIEDNPPIDDLWYCSYCSKPLTVDKDLINMGVEFLTLDHMNPRSRSPQLKYSNENLTPACYSCNSEKGSMSYEAFIEKKRNQ